MIVQAIAEGTKFCTQTSIAHIMSVTPAEAGVQKTA